MTSYLTSIMPLNYNLAFLAYNFLSNWYQNTCMTDKKIITRNDVKENNPNDDEEILKNDPDLIPDPDDENKEGSNNRSKKDQGDETIGIP